MSLRIHIDRLVLDGFDYSARDVAQLESALQRELARRLRAGGLSEELRAGGSMDALRPADVSLPDQPTSVQSGSAIARAIHRGIAK